MKNSLGKYAFIAVAVLALFSITALADNTQEQCGECGSITLASREIVGGWKSGSYLLPCQHDYSEGYDLTQERSVYTIKECGSCGFSNKEVTGKKYRIICYGSGRPMLTSNLSDGEISLSLSEIAEAGDQGEKLLREREVKSNQTIRFSYGPHIFETRGTKAVTLLKEARSSFPNWMIPEKLGDFQFADLTLYPARTSVVYPDTVSPAKNTTEILTDKTAKMYYLCYKNGSSQFRIEVLPDLKSSGKTVLVPPDEFVPWESHAGAYYSPAEEHSTEIFQSLWISLEPDSSYAFLIHKISNSDCLESEDVPFTIEEASAIYEGILQEFPKDPPQ